MQVYCFTLSKIGSIFYFLLAMNFKFFTLLFSLYLFSCCTPYWENEAIQELDHHKITEKAKETISTTSGKLQSENNLSTSAQKLEIQTEELSNEINDILNHFNEL